MTLSGLEVWKTLRDPVNRAMRRIYWIARAYFSTGAAGLASPSSTLVALTSYPARIRYVSATIRSLLWQVRCDQHVILVLCKTEFCLDGKTKLPRGLARLEESQARFSILWVDNNTGPYKKLLPVLESYPGRPVITVDDDVIYPPDLVHKLETASYARPQTIIGTRGASILCKDGRVVPYASWPIANSLETSHKVLLTGRGGIYYPANSLHPEVKNVARALEFASWAQPNVVFVL